METHALDQSDYLPAVEGHMWSDAATFEVIGPTSPGYFPDFWAHALLGIQTLFARQSLIP
jgi:hypothetical protein